MSGSAVVVFEDVVAALYDPISRTDASRDAASQKSMSWRRPEGLDLLLLQNVIHKALLLRSLFVTLTTLSHF